jgi:pregnancy-associated plasma protein-A
MRVRGACVAACLLLVTVCPHIVTFSTLADACADAAGPAGVRRDRLDFTPAEVTGLLAELRAALRDRYGHADEHRWQSTTPVFIPVRFHVLAAPGQGRVPRSIADRQIAALNRAYGGTTGGTDTGVRFRLHSYEITTNTGWFTDPRQHEVAFKRELHGGGRGTLNIYTAAVGDDVLGFSTLPQWARTRPRLDGVVVDYRSLPGGEYTGFNRGYTAVHEIGHWLGLFHTFENGCRPPGDAVDDTPDERLPTDGCPVEKDTCSSPGADPIHNFMDYGWDDCMSEFTPGQGVRIRATWRALRAGA